MSREYARVVRHKLRGASADLIVAPGGSTLVACLETDIPIVYASDTTFGLNLDYYPAFSGYPPREARDGHEIERRAIARAAAIVMPSEWAAKSARTTYAAQPESVHVVPFGANLDSPPSLEDAIQPRSTQTCELLFVARDWDRKGGDVAWHTVEALIAHGVDAHLTIVGCVPPDGRESPAVRVIPYIDKDIPEARDEFRRLLLTAHFNVLPTRADCTPIAICEASAHGLPTVVTDTGGVRGALFEHENGILVHAGATGDDIAAVVESVIAEPSRHAELSRSARAVYEDRLNWDSWGLRMQKILASVQ
jgi:glycosyltransferase involved in cell wall biosynthesis